MWKILRLIILLTRIIAILISDEGISTSYSGLSYTVIGSAILHGIVFATITGWTSIILKRKLPYLIRPSLSTSPLDKRVVLEFSAFHRLFLYHVRLS
jgi:hypothetical protein